MNDSEKNKNQKEAAGDDWAILPFDEKEDDERWNKLIAETDELAKKAAALEWDSDENSAQDNSPDDAATEPERRKSADDELAEINPF